MYIEQTVIVSEKRCCVTGTPYIRHYQEFYEHLYRLKLCTVGVMGKKEKTGVVIWLMLNTAHHTRHFVGMIIVPPIAISMCSTDAVGNAHILCQPLVW